MSKKDPKRVYLDSGVEVLNNYELLNFLRDSKKIHKSDLLVALVLGTRRNSVLACAYPSLNTIARDTGLSKRAVINSLKYLEAIEIIIIIHKEVNKSNTSNHYFFIYDLEYQHGLLDDEQHPLNKRDYDLEIFMEAYEETQG